MKKYQIQYVRTLIRVRRWANTERGERVIVTIGSIFMVLAFASFGLLVAGMLEPQMGLQRAIMLVVAFYVLLWGVCRTIQTNE